ncbi:MAG: GyrI-like domain-containing protein [Bacteroidetes bacterium]|nr:GyrI-like domain-containing protein [Bacteroidota bacterium]
MKTFKKIILVIGILVVILILISFLLPKTYHVERSTVIKADKTIIYNLTSNLTKWDLWAPWTKSMDSTAVFELIGPDGQIGTVRKWDGKTIGNGQMTLTQLNPGELVAYDLMFQHGKYNSKGKFIIEASGDSTKVSWSDNGDLGYNPISRYFGLFMGKMMGPYFEKGLAKLKQIAEARKGWPVIIEKQMPEQNALIIKDSAGPKTYAQVLGKGYGEIMQYIKTNKLQVTGPPFAIYLKWDSVTMFSVMDLCIPVEKAEKGKGRIQAEKLPVQNVVMALYYGPYDKTAMTYQILDQYCKESGKIITGGPWEIYVTDPMTEKDPMKVETDIIFPVK